MIDYHINAYTGSASFAEYFAGLEEPRFERVCQLFSNMAIVYLQRQYPAGHDWYPWWIAYYEPEITPYIEQVVQAMLEGEVGPLAAAPGVTEEIAAGLIAADRDIDAAAVIGPPLVAVLPERPSPVVPLAIGAGILWALL